MKTMQKIAGYISRTYRYGSNAKTAAQNLKVPVIERRANRPASTSGSCNPEQVENLGETGLVTNMLL
jgi:hypothetical protein